MRNFLLLIITLFSFGASASALVLDHNTITIRGGIDDNSMNIATKQLLKLSNELEDNADITIAIDSGGGLVTAGMNFIQAMKSVKQDVTVVCFFCASMAFSIFQHADFRYVTPFSVLMSHRAKGGFRGQFAAGEVEKRLGLWTNIIKDLEKHNANRLGLDLAEFQKRSKDEYWLYGEEILKHNAADATFNVRCTDKLIKGIQNYYVRTPFGTKKYKYSKCPLIKGQL